MILRKNAKIAIIAPSSGAAEMFPDVFNLGLENLKLMNYQPVIYPTCLMTSEDLYKNPKLRAEDINKAFGDKHIDGIICSIGGYDSIRILEYLDMDLILANKKPIMGFSDATTFLAYLNLHGLETYYGPSIMAGFAQLKEDKDYFNRLKEFLQEDWLTFIWTPEEVYYNGYKDWFKTPGSYLDSSKCQAFETIGHSFEGDLWGGCIEVLEFMKATKYWPDLKFFTDKILFLETSEEKPSPMQVGYMLRNYMIQGVFDEIAGLVIGRCKDYSDQDYKALKKILQDMVDFEYGKPLNIVLNVDIGHTDPKWILPYGARAKFDYNQKICTITR